MESIKDKVAIVGMGCSKFGELFDKDSDDLVVEATYEALADAGIELKDIQAGWVGCTRGSTGKMISSPLQLQYIPATHVENACGSGYEAVRNAAYAVAAKVYDLVLAVGVDKLTDTGMGRGGFHVGGVAGGGQQGDHPVYGAGTSPAGRYALAATRYFHRYGLSREEGKRMIGMVSVTSHHNGARNPKAMFRREVTIEEVINAPIIAWPLGLYDACGVADGCAVAIMCRTEDARSFKPQGDYITIKGIEISSGPGNGKHDPNYDFTHWEETVWAARAVYAQAGIKNPRKELDMIELHDCFSIAHVIAAESLGACEFGHAKEDIDAGAWTQEGEIPINISGGLKSFGHPLGATGVRDIYETYKQIYGKAQEPSRQLKNVRQGLCHNQGGHPGRFHCAVAVVGAP